LQGGDPRNSQDTRKGSVKKKTKTVKSGRAAAKNAAAVELGKRGGAARARKLTADQRSSIAERGGQARAKKLTAAQRKAAAKRAAAARWAAE